MEEVDRRKRRRERNKIAAAKCRNKKKEKTDCLQKVELENIVLCATGNDLMKHSVKSLKKC